MIFLFGGDFNYEVKDSSLYNSNNQIIIKKVEGIGDGTYELNVDAPQLILVPKRGYWCNERGGIEFDTQNKDKRIDFVRISSSVSYRIPTRLVITMRGPRLEWNEWSQLFYVIPKPNLTLSIKMRKDKKIDDITNDNDEMTTELLNILDSESRYGQNNIGDCDISFAVEELSQSVIRDKNHCWIINFMVFDKKKSNNRDKSRKNVLDIIKVFRDWSDFDLKVLINATKEGLFDYLREYIHKLEPSMKQLIIFLMSHGKCDGFVTSNNELVMDTEFLDTLIPITSCRCIKTMVVLSHCRDGPQTNTNSFYNRESISSSDDSDDGNDSQVDDSLISTKSKESKTQTSTNILNFPHENVLIAYSTSSGQVAYLTADGSLHVNQIMEILIERLPMDGTVELVGIINKVIELFKEHSIIHHGVRVYQQPCITGVISGGFPINYYREDKESGGDILGLPNSYSSETDH